MDGEIADAAVKRPDGNAAVPQPAEAPEKIGTPDHHPQSPASTAPVNQTAANGHNNPEEDEINDDLTPPPDSPVGDTMSPEPSLPVNTLHDEIVVGTNTNADAGKTSPLGVSSDREDVDMAGQAAEQPAAPPYPKRKRSSMFTDLSEDKIESSLTEEEPEPVPRPKPARPARAHGTGGVKGVVLGFWRDSAVPDEKDKHSVIGFIDVRDRLRTRIQPTTREGKNISGSYPLPPGPGGSWVTFERVAFDPHLVNLDHYQVKEYVKIRADTLRPDETPEEQELRNKEAVAEAHQRVRENPPPENGPPPPMAYGPQIPAHAQISHRPESKKRRIASGAGVSNAAGSPAQPHQTDKSLGTRPTRILLGCWANSSEENELDKHAVYGILGTNDMFRVKLVRETRDGRPLLGNFPVGPGGLWIQWNEVDFEKHLEELDRVAIKEYCRLRQRQLDRGELPSERHENELQAVKEALERVSNNTHGKRDDTASSALAMREPSHANGTGPDGNSTAFSSPIQAHATPGSDVHSLRQSHRETAPRARHSLPDGQLRAANRPQSVERTNSLALREVARAEALQMRADQRAASREPSGVFQDSVLRLNKVWAAQEANRLKEGAEDAKVYMGTKYERKATGPFEGKLVSQGNIISIDGEDYVEYRVLTKPSFF